MYSPNFGTSTDRDWEAKRQSYVSDPKQNVKLLKSAPANTIKVQEGWKRNKKPRHVGQYQT